MKRIHACFGPPTVILIPVRGSHGSAMVIVLGPASSANLRMPATAVGDKESVDKGALASYGESYYTIGRRSAKHIRQVLLGADPGDLPIEQLDKFQLVINLKTARALGLTIPPSLLALADQVIE